MNTVSLAKLAINASPIVPSFSRASVGELEEVFNTEFFINGSETDKREIMLGSSTSKYRGELEYPWDNYFGYDLAPFLKGKRVMDLGSHTGGRSVAWFERYGLAHISGVDVREEFIAAARQFAEVKGISADFTLGVGERLPFEDESFDAIVSFDVLEHVQNVEATMAECRRVLKPGGAFYLVFPGFYQPWEHHLTLATRTPCLHWFFRGKTLVRAYDEVLAERSDSGWYRRQSPELKPWERGHTVNGTTVRQFKRLIADGGWRVVTESKLPIGAIGRNASTHRAAGVAKTVAKVLAPLTNVPGAQELVMHRITYVLQKPD
ncbi:methyltransferase domain-containing protein [Mycolicibacterium aichiense]|uniref:class I SAM-dependent methyltransferase n=1 Tax=Mycolicibacterium aichiense TaxID=1799 RepID=UPI003D671899